MSNTKESNYYSSEASSALISDDDSQKLQKKNLKMHDTQLLIETDFKLTEKKLLVAERFNSQIKSVQAGSSDDASANLSLSDQKS